MSRLTRNYSRQSITNKPNILCGHVDNLISSLFLLTRAAGCIQLDCFLTLLSVHNLNTINLF